MGIFVKVLGFEKVRLYMKAYLPLFQINQRTSQNLSIQKNSQFKPVINL